ncbi:hypothetical protein Cgig2_016254 [Carnegiea gigantea]|uniref:F-box domain-containing protein n=1 Tax=Carnegiea gigantea TaxID=171969 RepID=A0A9Q1KH74_9CARY|nr:hypothetical protein Cgig2_016254 [Carnegiea gigantea]
MKIRSYSNLPEEIIVDILSRLPARTVGQCRCVSKAWRGLLSQPQFIRYHLRRSKILRRESLLLFSYSQRSLSSASLSNAHHLFDQITTSATRLSLPVHPGSRAWVYGSCDGLLLVRDEEHKRFVLNPITREIKEVPPLPFDPRVLFTMHGLGYDSVSDDYKVVTLCNCRHRYEPDCVRMFVNVYSLKSGSWESGSFTRDYDVGPVISGVFVNGCLHWLTRRTRDHKPAILAFDLAEDKFCEVPLPPSSSANGDTFVLSYLAELGGCLWILSENESESGTHAWTMKEYGVQDSWTKFTINYLDVDNYFDVNEIKPLCLLGQDEMVLLNDCEELVVYNLKEQTFKDILVCGVSEGFFAQVSFVESLISPHDSIEADCTGFFVSSISNRGFLLLYHLQDECTVEYAVECFKTSIETTEWNAFMMKLYMDLIDVLYTRHFGDGIHS